MKQPQSIPPPDFLDDFHPCFDGEQVMIDQIERGGGQMLRGPGVFNPDEASVEGAHAAIADFFWEECH